MQQPRLGLIGYGAIGKRGGPAHMCRPGCQGNRQVPQRYSARRRMSDQCRFALSNIVRHAHASTADVAVEVDTDLPVQRLRLKGRMALGRRYRHLYGWTAQASNNAAPSRFRSTMSTARDITHTGATCVGEHETLTAAAQHMGELGVGALPIPPATHYRQSSPGRHRQRSRHRSPSDRTCHRAVRQSDLRHPSHRQPLIPRQLGD